MAKAPKHSRRTQTGIELSREVKLKTEWPKFLSNMIKVAVSGFAAANGALEKVGDAGESLLEAGAAVKVDSPPGERGWTLFCLGFAWAFDELRISNQLDDIGIEAAVREALEKASLLVDQGGQVIPVSFLDRPTTLPLYTIVRDAFIERKGTFRPAGGEADEILRARFDAAFDRAIFLLWSQAPEIYQPLATALSVPAAKAHAYRLEWDSYRKSLIHLFEVKPVFGQEESKISLSQLYVQLRGVWREEPNETRNATGGKKPAKTVPEIGHLVQLDAELDHWATGGEDGYQLALIGGGPGSGKSTTVKALASRLAARENCRPLYVPLLHINPTRDLLAEINRYFTQGTDNPFRQPPLERSAVESGPPLVLIFDGLDEQAVTGKASDDLVRDFMIQLAQLAFSLKGERKGRLRTIVTGRMPSFQAAQRYATNLWRAYEVLGFLPLTNPVVQKLFTNVDSEEQQEIAKVDQRVTWWERYTTAVSGATSKPPNSLTDRSLAEITYEPLLCYLLVLSGYATDDVAIVSGNLNVIYQKLVEEVWRRGWGDGVAGQRHPGAGRFLDLDGFNSLMETIALAGWKGGDTRICTEQSFQLAAKALKTEEAWDKFVKDSGADITNLAINFYLKRSDTDARGFEFTHKSFGDYLAARALIRVAFEVGRLAEMREEAGLKGWFDIASDGRLSHEVLDFMTREFKLLVGADCREKVLSLKRTFEKLASSILRDGLPANGNASEAWRVAEKKQRDAEIMIWAILAGCSTALADSKSLTHTLNEDTLINVVWPDPTSLGDLLRRMTRQADLNAFSESALPANHRRSWSAIFKAAATVLSEYNINVPSLLPVVAAQFLWTDKIGTGKARPNKAATTFALRYRAVEADLRRSRVAADIAPVMRCFAFLNARCADLSCQIICGIDLRNADLREARFDNATILYGDLRGANLQRATFRNATLDNTLFGEADLTESMWPQAKISQTELSDAVLTGASLEGAIMLEGDIRTDDLKDKGALVAGIRTVQSQVRAEPSELPSTEKAASDEASAS